MNPQSRCTTLDNELYVYSTPNERLESRGTQVDGKRERIIRNDASGSANQAWYQIYSHMAPTSQS